MSLRQRRSCFHDVLSTWDYSVTCKFPVIASLNEMKLKPNTDEKDFNLPQTEEYETGFICLKVWEFALLILSHFS